MAGNTDDKAEVAEEHEGPQRTRKSNNGQEPLAGKDIDADANDADANDANANEANAANAAKEHEEPDKETDSAGVGSKRGRRPTINHPTAVSPSVYNI